MALSSTENIFNLALGYIGEHVIEDSSESRASKQYEICSRFIDKARDEILMRHTWDEALVQDVIKQDTFAPLFGYSYRFPVPPDSLRIVNIGDYDIEWKVKGGYILTDYPSSAPIWRSGNDYVAGQYIDYNDITYLVNNSIENSTDTPLVDTTNFTSQGDKYKVLNVEYVKVLTDPDDWSVHLAEAIAMNLAIKISVSLTNDTSMKNSLIGELEQLIMPKARSVDSQQGTPDPYYTSRWLRSRGLL